MASPDQRLHFYKFLRSGDFLLLRFLSQHGANIVGLLSTPEYMDNSGYLPIQSLYRRQQQSCCRVCPFHQRAGGGKAAAKRRHRPRRFLRLPRSLRQRAGGGGYERLRPALPNQQFYNRAACRQPARAAADVFLAATTQRRNWGRAARPFARWSPVNRDQPIVAGQILYFYQPQSFINVTNTP